MRRLISALFILMLFGITTPAWADHQTDFALFDETSGATGAKCGARKGGGTEAVAFVVHINVTNRADAGGVDGTFRVSYADGDFVDYAIKAGTTVSLSEAAGGTLVVNDLITVTGDGVGGSVLVGSMSIQTHGAGPHPSTSPNLCVTI